jgi:hypothetical protein
MMDLTSSTTRTQMFVVGGAGLTMVYTTEKKQKLLSSLWLVGRDFEFPAGPRKDSCVLNKIGPFVLSPVRTAPTKFVEEMFWLFACACAGQGRKILARMPGLFTITPAVSTVFLCFLWRLDVNQRQREPCVCFDLDRKFGAHVLG